MPYLMKRVAFPLMMLLATAGTYAEEHKAADEEKPAVERKATAEHGKAPAEHAKASPERAKVTDEHAKGGEERRPVTESRSADEHRVSPADRHAPADAAALPVRPVPVPPRPVAVVRPLLRPERVHVAHAAPADHIAQARTAVAVAAVPPPVAPVPGHAAHWSYEGSTGPEAWARLSPDFAACSGGSRQSPIDIRDGIKLELDPVLFEYRQTGFQVIDNGHTIQANVPQGNFIRVLGRRYGLVQFHFHRPSEELIDGRPSEMVVHLVHKDPEGRLAVVAVLVDRGAKQPVIQTVWNNLPLEKNEEIVASARIDLNQLLPENRKYITYMGSLTTPPCTEGVLWIVMKQPVQASAEQIDLFGRLYPLNARPVQAVAGRMIKESN